MDLNKMQIIGRLGNEPEIRNLNDGSKVANLSVATGEAWKDKATGEKKERTEWHRVTVFGPLADVVEKYLRKGSKVYFEGKLQTRKWQDQSGQDRYTTEVIVAGVGGTMIMLDGAPSQDRGQASRDQQGSGASSYSDDRSRHSTPDLDDEIPF